MYRYLQRQKNYVWANHMTLYRVCCIEYIWLFVNAQSVSDFYIKIIAYIVV